MEAYKAFVEECIIGRRNLWDKMTKVKQSKWMSAGKYFKLNTGTAVVTLKATTSLFARLLVIDLLSRQTVDLEEVIGMHEFTVADQQRGHWGPGPGAPGAPQILNKQNW